MKTSEFLRQAKALIDTPERWTQTFLAVDSTGRPISVKSPMACAFCSAGAINRTWQAFRSNANVPMDYLAAQMGSVPSFNDNHAHPEVMAAWDRAIAAAEADEAAP